MDSEAGTNGDRLMDGPGSADLRALPPIPDPGSGPDPRRSAPSPSRRSRQVRIRTMMLAIVVVAGWLLAFRVPGVRELVIGFASALGLGLTVGLGAALLGLLGFALFAAFDRLAAWFAGLGRWPDEPDGPQIEP